MFTKKFEYAFILLKELKITNEKKTILGKDILEKLNIPKSMGASILTELSNAGLILGKKGKQGGYYIAKKDITFYDLFFAIEEVNVKVIYHNHEYSEIMIKLSKQILNSLKEIKI